jgi:hypothetical protein
VLLEKPLSLLGTGISLALMAPECSALLKQPEQVPGSKFIAGAVVGAIGVYLGSCVAASYYRTPGRSLRLAAWGTLGLAMSASLFYFGPRVADWESRLPFFGAGCLPLGAFLYVLFQAWRQGILHSERKG